jgi:hypothetical protein
VQEYIFYKCFESSPDEKERNGRRQRPIAKNKLHVAAEESKEANFLKWANTKVDKSHILSV